MFCCFSIAHMICDYTDGASKCNIEHEDDRKSFHILDEMKIDDHDLV